MNGYQTRRSSAKGTTLLVGINTLFREERLSFSCSHFHTPSRSSWSDFIAQYLTDLTSLSAVSIAACINHPFDGLGPNAFAVRKCREYEEDSETEQALRISGQRSDCREAVEYSGHQKSSVYLAPPGEEPQQKGRRSPRHGRSGGARLVHTSSAAHSFPTHVSGASGPHPIPKDIIKHQYASDNILQYYEAYVPESNQQDPQSTKYWIIYIHGGYYRDPKVQASSFHRALASLVSNPLYLRLRDSIAGYASVNYRLSPHPDHPQNPDKTADYEMHKARHPDHINDVIAGIAELQKKYGFGSNYLLVGHSVGATLAFQLALCQQSSWQPPSTPSSSSTRSPSIDPPSGILGLNGIYSFPTLHKSFPSYVDMTAGALGKDPALHAAVSPATYPASTYQTTWTPTHGRRRVVILASSPEDTAVDMAQRDAMLSSLCGGGGDPSSSSTTWEEEEEEDDDDEDATDGAPTRSMSTATALSDATTINPATASTALARVGSAARDAFDVQTLQLKGEHDAAWRGGEGLARAIALAVGAVKRAERDGLRRHRRAAGGVGEARDFAGLGAAV